MGLRFLSGGFLQLSPGVRPRHQATVLLLKKKKKDSNSSYSGKEDFTQDLL